MTLRSKLALGFAVFTMGGTALASDASADRAAALEARGTRAEVRPVVAAKKPTPTSRAAEPCNREECCVTAKTAPAPSAPTFTDFG